MAKNKKHKAEEVAPTTERDFKILEAIIKDDFCHYKFEVTSGVGLGDQHQVKGKGIIKESLQQALANLNVHLAIIDDVFVVAGIDSDIDELKENDQTFKYAVSGFKVKAESVVLVGTKYVSTGGRISFETPKVSFGDVSPYKWYNELASAVAAIQEEVALYKEGNYIAVEDDPQSEDTDQLKMSFSAADDEMSDFENARL